MTATAERSAGENAGSPPDIGAVLVAVRPLVAVLHQLSDLSESLTDEQFTRVPGGAVSSTIGGHVRHNALIAVIVRLIGAEPPADFGYAPSTVAHQRSRPCAR